MPINSLNFDDGPHRNGLADVGFPEESLIGKYSVQRYLCGWMFERFTEINHAVGVEAVEGHPFVTPIHVAETKHAETEVRAISDRSFREILQMPAATRPMPATGYSDSDCRVFFCPNGDEYLLVDFPVALK